ncbi:DUF1186 domain-containing protein [Aquimarina sp. RZ0]|uniref:DUF1186 domain-containing protein n=1 Tax=Aquimarina sp. RZ0 TaxID=2607730 RepID=UPI0016600229|nr:DUF1186 domain-containing protein [Aquimarina sp. RZ0]
MILKNNDTLKYSFDIAAMHTSDDPDRFLDDDGRTPYINSIIEKLYYDVQKGKSSVFERLFKYIKRYPKIAVFKNYLAVAYMNKGNDQKFKEIVRKTVEAHPDYLFAKINLASIHIEEEKYQEAQDLLGDSLQLVDLYPEKELFHEDEVITYYLTVAKYLWNTNYIHEEEKLLEQLKLKFYGHHKIEKYDHNKAVENLKKARKRMEEEEKFSIKVATIDRRSHLQTDKLPDFNFPEQIALLYTSNLEVTEDWLAYFEKLPKNLLEEDLIKVLQDSIYRFDYFMQKMEDSGWNDYEYNAPHHAFYLLYETGTSQSLAIILEILRQDMEFMDLWFGDATNEIICPTLFKIAKDQLPILMDFVKEPHINAFNKSVVTDIVTQMPFVFPDTKEEVIVWFKEVFTFYKEHKHKEGIADTDFLGLLIGGISSKTYQELLPQIKEFFDLNLVGYWVCGQYDDVKNRIRDIEQLLETYFKPVYEQTTVKELYENYYQNWIHQSEQKEIDDSSDDFYDDYKEIPDDQPYIAPKKIGRNDPCLCGSGKKYKKCCINK